MRIAARIFRIFVIGSLSIVGFLIGWSLGDHLPSNSEPPTQIPESPLSALSVDYLPQAYTGLAVSYAIGDRSWMLLLDNDGWVHVVYPSDGFDALDQSCEALTEDSLNFKTASTEYGGNWKSGEVFRFKCYAVEAVEFDPQPSDQETES